MSIQNNIINIPDYDLEGLFSYLLRIIQGFKIPFIVVSLILLAGIVYFMVFTDYLYYKYFEQWEEYTKWKAMHKIPRRKKRKIIQKENPLSMAPSPPAEEPIIKESKPPGEWERIFEKLKSQKGIDYKLALVDADRLLAKKLEEAGIAGRNLDQQIENVPPDFKMDLSQVKKARNLLKEVFLEEKKKTAKSSVKEAIEMYKNAFDAVKI